MLTETAYPCVIRSTIEKAGTEALKPQDFKKHQVDFEADPTVLGIGGNLVRATCVHCGCHVTANA